MASYYYPFGNAPKLDQVDYTLTASNADAAISPNITVPVTSFASAVVIMPSAGVAGANKDITECTATAPKGPRGIKGLTGAVAGADLTDCPFGSVECVGLTPPSGFSKVCIQIPYGCSAVDVVCPPTIDGFATTTTTTTTTTTAPPCIPTGQGTCVEDTDCCNYPIAVCSGGTCLEI